MTFGVCISHNHPYSGGEVARRKGIGQWTGPLWKFDVLDTIIVWLMQGSAGLAGGTAWDDMGPIPTDRLSLLSRRLGDVLSRRHGCRFIRNGNWTDCVPGLDQNAIQPPSPNIAAKPSDLFL